MKTHHKCSTMPESQDKSPKQGDSAKPSVVEVLKSVVIRKRAKKAEELARKLKEEEQQLQEAAAAVVAAAVASGSTSINGIGKPLLSFPNDAKSYFSQQQPQGSSSPEPVPKKRQRKTPRWEDTPQLIDFNLPPPPLLPPIETFNILSSLSDTSSPNPWSPLYNGAKALDSETLNFIHRIYCKECRMEEQRRKEIEAGILAEGGSSGGEGEPGVGGWTTPSPGADQPISPMTVVEEQSLQMAMETNKESLKRKLMFRRSIPELVDQGIYPPLKTPPAFAEQRTKLERAKTGDFLRHKLQARPDRASLVEHHILEDSTVDPSLQEKQRLLKRARLQDSLSERLVNRPGPLELVERNILLDPDLDEALKEGIISFPKTSDIDDPHRRHYTSESEDGFSTSEDGFSTAVPSPQGSTIGSGDVSSESASTSSSTPSASTSSSTSSSAHPPPAPDITPLLQKFQNIGSEIKTCTFSQTPVPSSQAFSISGGSGGMVISGMNKSSSNGSLSSLGKAKKKKQPSSSRPMPSKSRVIKFHEYKGPPSLVKGISTASPVVPALNSVPVTTVPSLGGPTIALPVLQTPAALGSDSSYSVMLHQQQLLLQWQLEVQQKNLPFLVPTKIVTPDQLQFSPGSSASISSPGSVSSSCGNQITPSTTPQPVLTPCVTPVPPMSVTPQPLNPAATPPRALTPASTPIKSPAPTPSPASSSLFQAVPVSSPTAVLSPTPVPPPPPPLPPLPGVSTILAIPKSIPVVMPASNAAVSFVNTAPPTTTATIFSKGKLTTFPVNSTPADRSHQPLPTLKIINNNFSGNSGNSQNNKITKLEDLKVTDLKQECKKRNLPVSGPKPNLLNKLAPYADEIVKEYQEKQALIAAQNALNNIVQNNKYSNGSNSKTSSLNSNNSESAMKTPPNSASSIGSLGSVFAGLTNDDATMMPISPPTSPTHGLMDLNASLASVMSTPLSPEESMDIQMQQLSTIPGAISLASPPPLAVQQKLITSSSPAAVESSNAMSPTSLIASSAAVTPTSAGQATTSSSEGQRSSPFAAFSPQSMQSVIAISKPTTIASSSSSGIPMAVDPTSRPPSVTPMDLEDSINNASSANSIPALQTITQNQILQTATTPVTSLSSLSSIAPGTSFTLAVTQGGTPFTVSMTKLPSNSQVASQLQGNKIGGIQFARPSAHPSIIGPSGKPMQIQIAPSLSQIRPATAILKPVGHGQSGGVTQIHIPVSQIQPPIKVPIHVASSTQAKVHLPPGPIQFPVSSNSQQPGQIAVPVTGSLPMSAEVSIPVSGGTIQIPVSHLPPHLQQQVSIQIQQQLQQQAAAQLAKKTGASTSVVISKGVPTTKINPITGKITTTGKTTIVTNKLTQFSNTKNATVTPSGKITVDTSKTPQTSNGRPKALAKPRPKQGKGKNVKNANGGKNSNTTSPSPGSAGTQPIAFWPQPTQAQVIDIQKEASVNQESAVGAVVDIKQEKPCSPDNTMQTSPEQRLSPVIKTEPALSPEAMLNGMDVHVSSPMAISNILSHEDMVVDQQRQIEELRNQLINSQAKLQEAQSAALQHQEQLRKLTLAKIASLTQQNTLNALLAEQAKTRAQIQALTSVQNEQLNQLAQQNGLMSPTALISSPSPPNETAKETSPVSLVQTSQNQIVPADSRSSQSPPAVSTADKQQQPGNLTSLLQAQGLNRIDLSQTKIVQVINANGQPQFVLTSQPNSKPTTGVTNVSSGAMTTVTSNSKAQSVPSSPAAHTKLQRSATNPIFMSNDLKSPPNYDEAVKNKQNMLLSQSADGKYTQMDDVLDVLIQSGELPPSAAQEPPPTPKTQAAPGTTALSAASVQGAAITIPSSSVFQVASTGSGISSSNQFVVHAGDIFSNPQNGLILTSSAMSPITTASLTSSSPLSATNGPQNSAFINTSMVPSPCSSTTSVGSNRRDIPPPLSIDTASPVSNHDNHPMDFGDNLTNALSDLPLLDMEWTNTDFLSSPNFSISNEIDSKKDINLFTPPLSSVSSTSATTFSINDTKLIDMAGLSGDVLVPPEQMSIDVSDWLDAIMPSSGLTPLSANNAPATFNGDPVLTPKPQDVLDLFNMDDTDLCSTDLNLSINFDKAECVSTSMSNS